MVGVPTGGGKIVRRTVRQAMQRYIERKRIQGKQVNDLTRKTNVYILPELGDLSSPNCPMSGCRSACHHNNVGGADATKGRWQRGTRPNRPQMMRGAIAATANRALAVLEAGLNYAFDKKIGHTE